MTTPAIPPVPGPSVPLYPALGSANFNQEAYTYATTMPGVSAALGALAANVAQNAHIAFENAGDANMAANAASKSEAMAGVFASTAAAAVGVTRWLPLLQGGLYRAGDVVYSPINGQLYRRKGNDPSFVSGTDTDPSADPLYWWLIGAPFAAPIVQVAANTNAQAGMHYIIVSALTLVLPPTPAIRDIVQITDLSMSFAVLVDPGTKKISGATGQMLMNVPRGRVELVYSGDDKGWI